MTTIPLWLSRHQNDLHAEQQLARIALEVGEDIPTQGATGATAGGDERRLRGIPVLARGIGSTVPGTNPLTAYLAKERRAEQLLDKTRAA